MSSRRGFALLLVLAATMVVMAGITLAISGLFDARQRLGGTTDEDHLIDGLAAGERLALAWLQAHARQVVLPPEGGTIPLVHETWRTSQGRGHLTVVLHDGCAMIPARCAGLDGTLRAALPPGWSGVFMPELPAHQPTEPPDWLETVALPRGLRRFPITATTAPGVDWSTKGIIADGYLPSTPITSETGLAMLVSPHSQGAINVNTAPEDLLRIAFQQSGASGLATMIQTRRRGAAVTSVPELTVGKSGFRFVTASVVWYAEIRTNWNDREQSWWVVLAGNSTDWRIVQRHDADR
jgi:hypothetical protein